MPPKNKKRKASDDDDEAAKKKRRQEFLEQCKMEAEKNKLEKQQEKQKDKKKRRQTIDTAEVPLKINGNRKTGNDASPATKPVKKEKTQNRRQTLSPAALQTRPKPAKRRQTITPKIKEETQKIIEDDDEDEDEQIDESYNKFYEEALHEAKENRRLAATKRGNKVSERFTGDETSPLAKYKATNDYSLENKTSGGVEHSFERYAISCVAFLLGFLSVVGIYFAMLFLPLPKLFFGSSTADKLAEVSGLVATNLIRVGMILLCLVLIYGLVKLLLWYKKRVDSRKQVIMNMANIAKPLIKEKLKGTFPSDFIMEDVLDNCDKFTLYGAKIDRRLMRELWPDVENILLEDSRLQISDQIFEGKKRRCLRHMGLTSPGIQSQ